MHQLYAKRFASRTRDEWTAIFVGTGACFTPVLSWTEAAQNEHLRARSTLVQANGVDQAVPAPRFPYIPAGPVERPPQGSTPVADIDWNYN